MKEAVFTLNPGDEVTIVRNTSQVTPIVLRPYTYSSFNCPGCRKRHPNEKRHAISYIKDYEKEGMMIWPRIFNCGREECFNMCLLKYSEQLSYYSNLINRKVTCSRSVTCAHCNDYSNTYNDSKKVFLQSYFVNEGKEIPYLIFCSVDCFKYQISKDKMED